MNAAAVRERLRDVWGGDIRVCAELPEGVEVVAAEPAGRRGWHSFATAGLSETPLPPRPEAPGPLPASCEVVTYAGEVEDWPVDLLARVVEFVLSPGSVAAPYQTLSLGGPVDGLGSTLTSVLLLPPYFESNALASLGGEPEAAVLWAVPITTGELELAVLAGGRALEDLLFEADLPPCPDLQRASLT